MTGAALAIALFALSAAPAAAGFRYVPPVEAAAEPAEAIAKSPGAADIGPPPGPGLGPEGLRHECLGPEGLRRERLGPEGLRECLAGA